MANKKGKNKKLNRLLAEKRKINQSYSSTKKSSKKSRKKKKKNFAKPKSVVINQVAKKNLKHHESKGAVSDATEKLYHLEEQIRNLYDENILLEDEKEKDLNDEVILYTDVVINKVEETKEVKKRIDLLSIIIIILSILFLVLFIAFIAFIIYVCTY